MSATSPAALPAAKSSREPHDLNRPDCQCAEVVDVSGAGDAKGHREPGDEWVVGKTPEKGRGGPAHAEPALEGLSSPGFPRMMARTPLLYMRQRKAQMTQRGIGHPRMTLTRQARLRRSKALLWSASVAAGMRARAGSSHPRQTVSHGSAASPRKPFQRSLGAAGGLVPKGFQMPEGGGDVGPARAAPPTGSGLMHGEHGLNDGTNDVMRADQKILRRVLGNWRGR